MNSTVNWKVSFAKAKRVVYSDFAIRIIAIAALFVIWEGFVFISKIPEYLLPTPSNIVLGIIEDAALLWRHTLSTVRTLFEGLLLAVGVGFTLGFLFYSSFFLRMSFLSTIVALRSVPEIAFAPLYIAWFGFGDIPKVIITAQVAFFPIFLSTLEGFANVDKQTVLLMRSLNATQFEILRKVRLPSALASLMTGLRTTLVFGLLGAVVGEWIVVNEGLGVIILAAGRGMQTNLVFEVLFILSSLGLFLFALSFVLGKTIFRRYMFRSKGGS